MLHSFWVLPFVSKCVNTCYTRKRPHMFVVFCVLWIGVLTRKSLSLKVNEIFKWLSKSGVMAMSGLISPFSRLWLLPGFLCPLDGEAVGFRVWRYMVVYNGNFFGFCFPGAPSPATLKVGPNSNSWLRGLSVHMTHSWLNVLPDLTRWWFLWTSSSGIRSRGSLGVFKFCICAAGGDWGFLSNGFVNIPSCICFVHTRCNTPPVDWRSLRLQVLWDWHNLCTLKTILGSRFSYQRQ